MVGGKVSLWVGEDQVDTYGAILGFRIATGCL